MRYVGLIPTLILVFLSQATTLAQEPETPPSGQPAAYQTQMIWFARSGKTVTVELAPTRAHRDRATLLAFGRAWTEPVSTRKQGIKFVADFKAPSVRVPTVFTIAHPDSPNQIMGYLVAYPDRDVKWDEKISLYSCGAPGWCDQWAAATGLPVKAIAPADLPEAKLAPVEEKGRSLLILGPAAAGKDLPDAAKLANEKKVNVLVLDAAWFGEAAGAASVAPAQMLGGLSEIAKQRWPQPLQFSTHRKPWPGIANRSAWIVDETGLPLVEQAGVIAGAGGPLPLDKDPISQSVILSYVQWQEQLGRSESADATLLAALAAASGATAFSFDWYHGWVVTVWPSQLRPRGAAGLGAAIAPSKDRPVLSAIVGGPLRATGMGPHRVTILDLRGKTTLSAEEQAILDKAQAGMLILGDDKVLDEWESLKLDREKKRIGRAGVQWLPDDELPPSKETQVKLMLKLTELGVPLAPPWQEEKEK